MPTRRYTRAHPEERVPLVELQSFIVTWIQAGEGALLSPGTLWYRRYYTSKLLWWCNRAALEEIGTPELREFFAYLATGHLEPAGRWEKGEREPLRPSTAKGWHSYLASLFSFMVEEGALEISPMARIKPPRVPDDQVEPFTPEQVLQLIAAARRSRYHRRDTALVWFLFDTGARCSEAAGIRWGDVQLSARRVTVLGKGNKRRSLHFGQETARALWSYVRAVPRDPADPLFISERHAPFTAQGMRGVIHRLGEAAHLTGVRCSPHTFRHAFSIEFLRGGADTFSLQQALGHSTLAMSRKYAKLAEADLERAHRAFSPGDRLKRQR